MNNETNPLREERALAEKILSRGMKWFRYKDLLEDAAKDIKKYLQSQSLPAVEQPEKSTSAKDFELIAFAHYVQDCIRFKGELTYPEHKALVQAWKETYKSQQPSQPEAPKIKTKVVHSNSNAAWNVIGLSLGKKHKIAVLPYIENVELSKKEALKHAEFISHCFNSGYYL